MCVIMKRTFVWNFTCFIFIFVGLLCTVNTTSPGQHGDRDNTIKYEREFLLSAQHTQNNIYTHIDFPPEMKRDSTDGKKKNKRKRGKKGGVRQRLKRKVNKPPLPSIILDNTRSLRPKHPNPNFDELRANVAFMEEFRNACILCFSETWWCGKISDNMVNLNGFGEPFRCDRNCKLIGKKWGGGVGIYVNEAWCPRKSFTVKKKINTANVD